MKFAKRNAMRFAKNYGIIFVAVLLVLGSALTEPLISSASRISELQQSIKDKENQLAATEDQLNDLKNGITDAKKVLNSLSSAKDSVESYVTQLDAALTILYDNIDRLEKLIANKETDIEEASSELVDAQTLVSEQYEAMKQRIRFMYERSSYFFLELFLTADSFSQLLTRANYIEKLTIYDRKMLDEYQANVEYMEACKAMLEAEKVVLGEAKSSLDQERLAMEELIAAKEQEIQKYQQDISQKENLIDEYEREMQEQEAVFAALEAALQADKEALDKARGFGDYDGGTFTWPCPKYTYISSDYGWRVHPVYKVKKYHNGVDMASGYGTPIVAAYKGVVVAATYQWSMGNYVMVDHGSGLYTIYMHASKLYVAVGDKVSAGDKIAAVGSTGTSTGNHLHFGVRLNGSYVSPWEYLPSGNR